MNNTILLLLATLLIFTSCKEESNNINESEVSNVVFKTQGDYDYAQYLPNKSITTYLDSYGNKEMDTVSQVKVNRSVLEYTLTSRSGTSNIKQTIKTDRITQSTTFPLDEADTNVLARFVNIGDVLYIDHDEFTVEYDGYINKQHGSSTCKVIKHIPKFAFDRYRFEDVLAVECIEHDTNEILFSDSSKENFTFEYYDIRQNYFAKGIGAVATVNKQCIEKGARYTTINDRLAFSECYKEEIYSFYMSDYTIDE